MERRHQVFISSTFSDLVDERAEIIQALLELDCIPAGMEMFPATNETAWELIKGVIDDSDYYCLVIGGRYGSLDKDGVGFTEKEYDYALSIGKPLMAFLHKSPEVIPSGKCEQSQDGKEKLSNFRNKVETAHHCKYWSSPEELGGQVSRGLISLRKSNPSDGWVPGAYAQDEASRIELISLRARVAELEAELAKKSSAPEALNAQNLSSGADKYNPTISFYTTDNKERDRLAVPVTWDGILRYVGPSLLSECSEEDFLDKLRLCFYHSIMDLKPNVEYGSIIIPHVVLDQIKIQLRALGYMAAGTKRRAVSDRKIYWKLTQSGESRLLSAQALSKPAAAQGQTLVVSASESNAEISHPEPPQT